MLQLVLLLIIRTLAETSCLQRKLDDRCQKARKCIGMSFARFDGENWSCYEKVSEETSLACIDDQAKLKICHSGDSKTSSCDRAKIHKLMKSNKIKRLRKSCLVKISTTTAPTTSLATVAETGCLQKQLNQHCQTLEGQLRPLNMYWLFLSELISNSLRRLWLYTIPVCALQWYWLEVSRSDAVDLQ